jgi:hypothetical protein
MMIISGGRADLAKEGRTPPAVRIATPLAGAG